MTALDKLCTPPDVLELVRKVGPIGFDPFPGLHSLVNPRMSAPEDGFDGGWFEGIERGEVVFGNPPYSRGHLPKFAAAWAALGGLPALTGTHAIALLPAATGTKWFDVMCRSSKVLVLWRGRITFWMDGRPTKGGGKFDSALWYNGPNPYRFADVFAPFGRVVML